MRPASAKCIPISMGYWGEKSAEHSLVGQFKNFNIGLIALTQTRTNKILISV